MGAEQLTRGRNFSTAIMDTELRADWLRLEVINMIHEAGLGHYSSTFSCAEVLSVLYYEVMRLDPADSANPARDRFLLGKGHAAVGLWPILHDLGYLTKEDISDFGFIGSKVGDHPDMLRAAGVDFSSGSLGHNLSVGLGMGLGARLRGEDFHTYVLLGDGEVHEGQVWEAAATAGFYKVNNLTAIVDSNGFIGSGPIEELMGVEPLDTRFESFGWDVVVVDGHDTRALLDVLTAPVASDKPRCIIARTYKGKGVDFTEADPRKWHIGAMSDEERESAIAQIEARMTRVGGSRG